MDQDRSKNRMVDYENGENGFKGIQDQPPAYAPYTSKNEDLECLISQPEAHTFVIKPQDYLGWSIFNLICCCGPLGIAALVFSVKSRSAAEYNDYRQAKAHGKTARSFNLAGIIIGTTIIILLAVFYFVLMREVVGLIDQNVQNEMTLGTDYNGMKTQLITQG